MSKYSFDSKSLFKDEKRFFPIMGEIHYSRYPSQYWRESLNKLKAGGIDIASTYVIWIHHEEIEGQYDFTGDRNLHEFVQACKDTNMKLILRIGPWSHAEARNGGFPDWLLNKDFQVRTNDQKYFDVVKKWYQKIYDQVSEFICNPDDEKYTNPIIGVQIENEFGHCGGLSDESGDEHMKILKKMAEEIGFVVPLYTATGWGGARTGGMIPVMGGYCDAPWDQRTTEIEPSGNYVFTHERNDHNIGSDYGFCHGITFDIEKFPYLTAELGGGLQPTAHRRTIATAQDIGAVTLVKMGSGVNLLGYYMYHGGTNPDGKLTTLQESRETGYPNDLPVKNYDFRAPVREYGQISSTFRELKLYSYFIHSYGSDFCSLNAEIPSKNPLDPADTKHLRYSFRMNNNSGYVFVSNYVRHLTLKDHKNVCIKVPSKTSKEKIKFPKITVKNQDYFFLPFNQKYGETLVKTATVTPLCNIKDLYIFYTKQNESRTENFFQYSGKTSKRETFLVLSRDDALNTWKTDDGNLFISDGVVYDDENGNIIITGNQNMKFYTLNELDSIPQGFVKTAVINKNIATDEETVLFNCYELKLSSKDNGTIKINTVSSNEEKTVYKIDLTPCIEKLKTAKNANDCFVKLFYEGYSAELYATIEGKRKLIDDHFFLGSDYAWEIGLKRYLDCGIDFSNLEIEIKTLESDSRIYLERWPSLEGDKINKINSCTYELEYKFTI